MIFSGITFLYLFLPAVLILYYLLPKGKNIFLLVSSLVFYAYGSPHGLPYFFMVLFTGILCGYLLEKLSPERYAVLRRVILAVSVLFCLAQLFYFKYKGGNALPVGISFYSFQTIGYLVDLYRKTSLTKHNWLLFSTYVAFFPQLIAGPIVRYRDMEQDLIQRKHSLFSFWKGIGRFLIGLSKKLLLADQLAECVSLWQAATPSVFLYWMIAIAYTLQIYFDFSGYSDMAIGMGQMFSIRLPENFNYPYVSQSITEFWRRWHMTLSSWFKDYVYIPLGGSRAGMPRTIRNLLIVFALTGLWHGIGWQFLSWGLFYGVILVLEKLFFLRILEKIPRIFRHIYTMLMVVLGFVIFAAPSLSAAVSSLAGMFGHSPEGGSLAVWNTLDGYYFKDAFGILLFAGIFSLPVLPWLKEKLSAKFNLAGLLLPVQALLYPLLLILCTAWIIQHSAQPFLYFQF